MNSFDKFFYRLFMMLAYFAIWNGFVQLFQGNIEKTIELVMCFLFARVMAYIIKEWE